MNFKEYKTYLLKACFNLFSKQKNSAINLIWVHTHINYKKKEVNGLFLMLEISYILYLETKYNFDNYDSDAYKVYLDIADIGATTSTYNMERKENMTIEERKTYLLKACFNLLSKQLDSSYVLDLLAETINYDGTECDGECLMEDIASIIYEENPNYENDEVLYGIQTRNTYFGKTYEIV
jgi:hypothetical protein